MTTQRQCDVSCQGCRHDGRTRGVLIACNHPEENKPGFYKRDEDCYKPPSKEADE